MLFRSSGRLCDDLVLAARQPELRARLDARLLAALAAALGGFVPGRGAQRLVEGRNFAALVGRWTAEHNERMAQSNERHKLKRRTKLEALFAKDCRTVRGAEPWKARNWIGR